MKYGKIRIGDGVTIGARVTVLPGVSIGNESIVGACSLVTKSVPAGEVWGGVPAKFLMTTDEYQKKLLDGLTELDLDNYYKNKKSELLRKIPDPEWL
ncbi:MAG: acyltransferase [Clostridia bacterium]|nr:acyltransferase [Clostridia bacterium]